MIESERPWIVGHRGVAAEATENTLASFELAIDQRADMVELDVQLTADDRLIAFHDWDLTRLAGRPEVVEETAARELATLLPDSSSLPEILSALPEEIPLNVELKRRHADPESFVTSLNAALGDRERILLSSFDWELLELVHRRCPERHLAPLAHESTDGLLEAAERLGAWSVHCHWRLAEPALVTATPLPVLVYTVNDAAVARELFARGVAGVFTDAAAKLRHDLKAA